MKKLYLLRHAKSSWDDPDLDDFDRPLNERGEKDAPLIGERLRKHEIVPDIFYSSPALRAITTAKIIAGILECPLSGIHTDQNLYHASEMTLIDFLKNAPDKADCIFITGHNPGLTDFANLLQKELIDNIPTTGVVGIEFKISLWKDVKGKSGKMMLFEYPKR